MTNMAARQRGLLIVTLRDIEDVAGTKKRISGINGVVSVSFNQLTRKLLVRYQGDEAALLKINQEIKKILDGGQGTEGAADDSSLKNEASA